MGAQGQYACSRMSCARLGTHILWHAVALRSWRSWSRFAGEKKRGSLSNGWASARGPMVGRYALLGFQESLKAKAQSRGLQYYDFFGGLICLCLCTGVEITSRRWGADGRAPRWGGMALAFAALAGQPAPPAPPLWPNGWSCCPRAFGIRDAPERSPRGAVPDELRAGQPPKFTKG